MEQALTNVREEIERMEGRRRFLSDQVAMATITVVLHESYPLVAAGHSGFFAKMRRGLERGFTGFADVLSAGLTLLLAGIPVFVFLALAGFVFRKYRGKSRAKPMMAVKKEE